MSRFLDANRKSACPLFDTSPISSQFIQGRQKLSSVQKKKRIHEGEVVDAAHAFYLLVIERMAFYARQAE